MSERKDTTDGLGSADGVSDALERVRRLRGGLVDEIARREKELLALRGRLSGVEMVISECADEK